MSINHWLSRAGWASTFALTTLVVPLHGTSRATADDQSSSERIVEISPSDEADDLPVANETEERAEDEAPQYWIGLQGRPIDSPALRTHLQLAGDVGVLVENVVPDSPAAKAGLQQHDVIVAVNGEPINDLSALQKVVAEGRDKAIELKIIRLAQESKVKVTPEKRPADAIAKLPGAAAQDFGMGGQMPDFDAVIRQFQEGGVPGGVRVFGPGMVLGEQFNLNAMPNGVSVSMSREGDGPAQITVKKGDETWTFKSDDEKAIKKLPDDVRPFVQQMLSGSGSGKIPHNGMMDRNLFQQVLPQQLQQAEEAARQRAGAARERTEAASERLLKRMEEMEKRMQQLQRQLDENPQPPRTKTTEEPSKS